MRFGAHLNKFHHNPLRKTHFPHAYFITSQPFTSKLREIIS